MTPADNVSVPYVNTAQMIEVDRAMVEDYGIGLIQMMENAGRNLARLARSRFLAGNPIGKRVAVMAGPGGNGGGALVAARHLDNWGAGVRVYLSRPDESMAAVPRCQLDILRRMAVPVITANHQSIEADARFDLIVDGLLGYSLKGAPRGACANSIRWAMGLGAPILSLDTPSGIDATSGAMFDPAIKATATMTLALPKTGLKAPEARALIGELYLADIGVPPELYAGLGFTVGPLFAENEIIRLW